MALKTLTYLTHKEENPFHLLFIIKQHIELSKNKSDMWSDTDAAKQTSKACILLDLPPLSDNTSISYEMNSTSQVGDFLQKGIANLMGDLGIVESFMASKGITSVPDMINRFEKVAPRSFTINYNFLPKSKEESKSISDIIYAFKAHSLPYETSSKEAGFDWSKISKSIESNVENLFNIYKLPDIFHISVQGHVPKSAFKNKMLFKPCFLTNVRVDYGEGEEMLMYTDGTPVNIRMSLNFSEIVALRRNDFLTSEEENGHSPITVESKKTA